MSSGHHLVAGLGMSGEAVAGALLARGERVVVVEDAPSDASRERAGRLPGATVVLAPPPETLAGLVAGAAMVVASPGVPPTHPLFGLAAGAEVPVVGEIELAFRWARVPLVAVTGTNGKTTVTSLVAAMLSASGARALAAGNIGLPLVEAVSRDVDVIVAEVSSFQLALTDTFRPAVAVWLNLADDHYDWHRSLDDYAAAKARIWANQQGDDLAVVNADDPVVMGAAAGAPAHLATFGLAAPADWTVRDGALRGPFGEVVAEVGALRRALPHDLANGLAAAAAATAAGAGLDAVRDALTAFETLPHRVALVEDAGGVRWYDDSKATNPHAALAAVRAFDSVVLIAGGRNKGLDLSVLAAEAGRVKAVVGIGEAGGEVTAAFAGRVPVAGAATMDEAVAAAAAFADTGDVVLLSPGCASFDWYRSYSERGDDFARAVRRHLQGAA